MITWVLQSSLCWLFFLLIYRLFLQKETFFRFNRYYLLGTLILGGLFPIGRLAWVQLVLQDRDLPVFTSFQGTARILDLQSSGLSGLQTIDWFEVFSFIYWIGVAFVLFRLAKECWSILKLIRSNPKIRTGDYIRVTTHFEHLPFSFLHYIFISDQVKFKDEELNRILRHESSHVMDNHTLDVLLVEIISALAWLSPLVYWYKKSIRNTHEYLADALVTVSEDKNSYGRLLIDHSHNSLHMSLANHFIYSQLKNRINMMMKLRSRPIQAWKYTLILPILLILGILFAYKSDVIHTVQASTAINATGSFTDSIFTEVDQMPRFPGCNHLRSKQELTNCSLQNMINYLSKSTRYPGSARQLGIQGTALVGFVVNTDGSLSDFELLKDPGSGTGAEALRVATAMNKMESRWTPGELNGKPVRVKMTLPVQFKLEETSSEKVPGKLKFSGLALYVLNGDKVSSEEIENIPPDQIQAITVLKDEKAIEKYGPEAKFGVIEITTKPKYIIDGVESTREILDKINSDQIATVDIVKFGEKEPGVVNVRTKLNTLDELTKEKLLKLLGSTDKTLLVMDGKPTKLEELLVIADKIKSIHQMELKEAIKKYGEPAKFGAVEFLSQDIQLIETKIYNEVDEMPRFAGCEQVADLKEKQSCSIQKMSKFIYSHLSYPAMANQQGIEGRVVVSFIVDESGKIFDPKLIKDIGGGCGEEALRVINSMNSISEPWIPGMKDGKKVSTQFNLPIEFKLNKPVSTIQNPNGVPKVIDKNNPTIKLIPNPSSHQVEVVWDKTGVVKIEIYDISGKRLHNSEWADFRGSQVIDVKSMSSGTYIVKVRQGNTSQEQKLIIQ